MSKMEAEVNAFLRELKAPQQEKSNFQRISF